MFRPRPISSAHHRIAHERGSMLLTAMLFATAIALALGSYLALSRTTLKTAHRTFFANDATNLAEAGLEKALYSFNLMGGGTAAATAWSGWSFSGNNAMRTLDPFNRDQNAIGVVKVYVKGYDGTDNAPYIISQATITPFDGSKPIVRTVQLILSFTTSPAYHGLVGLNGLTLDTTPFADSFSALLNLVYVPYTTLLAQSQASVVVLSGTINIANGLIKGNLYLGTGVTSPSQSNVTGTITTNYSATFPFPTYPTVASVNRSYDLGTSIPAALPRLFDSAASDGRYYYFCRNTTITNVGVTLGNSVSLTGTNTGMGPNVNLGLLSSLHIYMDKAMTLPIGSSINPLGWAGALKIYTTTASTCTIGNNSQLVAWFQAPNADFQATGTSANNLLSGFFLAKTIYASGTMNFHYDTTLPSAGSATSFQITRWLDLQLTTDRAAVPGLTGNYLQSW